MKKTNKVVLFFLVMLFAATLFVMNDTVSAVFVTPPTCNGGDGCMPNCPGAPDPDCTTGCADISGSAGLIPCGKSVNDPDTAWNECSECNLCFMILMGRTIIEFFIKLTAVAAILAIIIGGLLYVFAAGSAEVISKAKLAIKYSIFGFITVFVSWAIVDSALIVLGYADPMESDGWYNVTCDLGAPPLACVPSLTCVDYPGKCGSMLSNGCVSILDCSGACIAPQICCLGICQNPVCSNDGGCNDLNNCTGPDTCASGGTCTASCSNPAIVACINGDGCCPTGCVMATDSDCTATCPDGSCDVAGGECSTCLADCSVADCCGFDPLCNAGVGEDCSTCSADCGVCPATCPDGSCDVAGGECNTCLADCDLADCCGTDTTCNAGVGEDCSNCADCHCILPKICCSGACQDPQCDNNDYCDDGDVCTKNVCSVFDPCVGICSNPPVDCDLINSDTCCPPACDAGNDIDCGAPPPACVDGTCSGTDICVGGVWVSHCADGIKNCLETDIDCGGGGCPACAAEPALPSSFDWSHKILPAALPVGGNWMSPVKHQYGCGACWAFSVVGVVEAMYNIEQGDSGLDVDLSEQHLITDCVFGGCASGSQGAALHFIENTYGIVDEDCLKYKATDILCSVGCSDGCLAKCDDGSNLNPWKISWYSGDIIPSNREEIKDLLFHKGPLIASLKIYKPSEPGGWFDGNSIYRCAGDFPNHGVVLVGYNDDEEYWIIKNSWGTGFGSDGYYKLGYGECGLESWMGCCNYLGGVTKP